ncbi:hypothetical protein ABT063_01875 [Streptomyces sp. NPDC002838]|uniref:hypothetical protein n=1 Tax=Streptomyces sp. NPDC002838 TaxID=3154436 RepID=UPI00333387EF
MAGGHLNGTTGDRGQVHQAGGNIISSTVNNSRLAGLTVLATMIVAAVGVVGVYAIVSHHSGGGVVRGSSASSADASADDPTPGDDAAEKPGAEAAPGPETTPSTETRSSPPQDPPASPAAQWRGTLLLDTEGRELDSSRPSKVASPLIGGDIGLGYGNTGWQVVMMSSGTIALWKEPGKEPGHADCAASTDTAGSYMAPVRQGAVLCVRTDEGRIARLEITKSLEGYVPAVEFDAIVWELSAPQGG